MRITQTYIKNGIAYVTIVCRSVCVFTSTLDQCVLFCVNAKMAMATKSHKQIAALKDEIDELKPGTISFSFRQSKQVRISPAKNNELL